MSGATWARNASLGIAALISSVCAVVWLAHDSVCSCHHREPRPEVASRLTSPRAALRTFYAAIAASAQEPERIDDAAACLDLTKMPQSFRPERDEGRLAANLDVVLRSLGVRSFLASEEEEGPPCVLAEADDSRVVMERCGDGAWRFDRETVRRIPAMRVALLRQSSNKAEAPSDVPGEYRSPRSLVQTFQSAMHRADFDAAGRCFDLAAIPAPAREALGPELALKLNEVLNRTVMLLEQDLPDQNAGEPIQILARREGGIGIERLSTGDRRGQWLFNQATVRTVERLYDALSGQPIWEEVRANGRSAAVLPFRAAPGLWVRHHLPQWCWLRMHVGNQTTLDAYQLIGLALVVAGALSIRVLTVRAAYVVARAVQQMRGRSGVPDTFGRLVMPAGWLLAVETVAAGVALLDLRQNLAIATIIALSLLRWAAVSWVVYGTIDVGLERLAVRRLGRGVSARPAIADMLFPLVALLLRIVVVLSTLLVLLQLFELNVATALAGLGIGGIAFALAAQDSLKNFFGSLTLIFDRTFYVGDLVKIGETEGRVESVGLRSTRIRALDDALMTIPNSELTTVHVTNYGARRYRRLRTTLGVVYGTTPETLEAFRAGIVDLIESHPATRKEEYGVAVHNLADSAVEILINVFFLADTGQAEMSARESLILDVLRLAQRLGVDFAFPTKTVHLARPAWWLDAEAGKATEHHGIPAPHIAFDGRTAAATHASEGGATGRSADSISTGRRSGTSE
jgi:MscS family membrane protein